MIISPNDCNAGGQTIIRKKLCCVNINISRVEPYCSVNVLGLERPHPRKQLPAIFEILPFRFFSAEGSSSSMGRPMSLVLSLIGRSEVWSSTRGRQNT